VVIQYYALRISTETSMMALGRGPPQIALVV